MPILTTKEHIYMYMYLVYVDDKWTAHVSSN